MTLLPRSGETMGSVKNVQVKAGVLLERARASVSGLLPGVTVPGVGAVAALSWGAYSAWPPAGWLVLGALLLTWDRRL